MDAFIAVKCILHFAKNGIWIDDQGGKQEQNQSYEHDNSLTKTRAKHKTIKNRS